MLEIPSKFKEKLEKDPFLNGEVIKTVSVFSKIFEDNKLYFFPEYTDHGFKHINSVLRAAEEVIDENTLEKVLSSNDIAILILSILLHDLGMQLSFDSFKGLIDGRNDEIRIETLDEKTWSQLWEEYLDEAKKFSSKQLNTIFGNEFHSFKKPDLNDRLNITEADKLLIGEFIRRNHARIAHEVALKGLLGKNQEILEFAKDTDIWIKQLAGIIARSHGIEIRDTFDYLHTLSEYEWSKPYSVNVTFLMVVLRIADYFQFDASRIEKPLLKLKTFSSPISQIEHDKHLSIEFVKPLSIDPETLYVEAKPIDSNLFLKLVQLFKSIQYELDISWAVLGEIYGKDISEKQPQIKYRRIKSNLDKHGNFAKGVSYVPEKMIFDYDPDLAKLLIAPLYGNNPTYGVRELLQNAIDACRERELEEKKLGNDYEPLIKVSITEANNQLYFTIEDNGKGMTFTELKNYFLKAGSSFRKSIDWQKKYTNDEGKSEIMRSGRFGVGVLAAFLLGDEIEVETKNINDKFSYSFKAKLDSEQLNIEKDFKTNQGTKIKILLESEKLNILTSSDWRSWYKFRSPKIQYFDKGNLQLVDVNLIDQNKISDNEHEIYPNDFEKVIWCYDRLRKTTCNGIVIPNSYSFGGQGNRSSLKTPTIHIIDYNARLDLNLSRESVLGILPFEKELTIDIYKDFIAHLLLIESPYHVMNNKLIKMHKKTSQEHPSGLKMDSYFYTNTGFLIDNKYFIQKCKENKLILNIGFKANQNFEDDFIDFNKTSFSNHLINIQLSADINNFSSYIQNIGELNSGYLQLYYPTRIFNSQEIFDIVFGNDKRVHHSVRKNYKIEEKKYDWICWNYDNYNDSQRLTLDDIQSFLPKLAYITEEKFIQSHHHYYNNSTLLNQLLTKYFGDNYIIPYDIEERKKLYSKAFEELEPYMRKYLIN